ncbi:MAG: PEP-CTERM sorting domain-containing protein [Planctomycetota bacterium]
MKTQHSILSLTVAATLAGLGSTQASAQTALFTGTSFEVSISDFVGVGDGSENLVSTTVSVTNLTGEPVFNPSVFTASFSGPLHQEQVQFTPVAPVTTTPLADSATALVGGDSLSPIDTAFLLTSDDVLLALTAPNEEEITAVSAEASTLTFGGITGFSQLLEGSFSIEDALNPATLATVDLAQLVFSADDSILFDFVIAGGEPGNTTSDTGSVIIAVPEPTSLALLSLASLALAGRRRKG